MLMKPQDIVFLLTLIALVVIRKEKLFVWAGLGCFLLAIPLFATWTFFTAERLTWYGSGFILIFLFIQIFLQPKGLASKKGVSLS